MVTPPATAARVVLAQHRDIQIPGLHLRFARIHDRKRAVAKAHWREPGRAAQALLRTTVDRVDAPIIHLQFMTAEAGDRIHHQQRAFAVHEIGKPFERLMRASARLRMHDAHKLRFRMLI